MLIGLQRKFIFIANLKSASTAIEQALWPISEIALLESRFGKHSSFASIEENFEWLFNLIDFNEFFIFGVIRDPVDFVISLYNSHMDQKFREAQNIYTGLMGFDQFVNQWVVKNSAQVVEQHTRFLTRDGDIAADYVISYDKLSDGLKRVSTRLRAPALLRLPTENVSVKEFTRDDLTQAHREWITNQFRGDFDFIRSWCDRVLTEEDRRSWRVERNCLAGKSPMAVSAPPPAVNRPETPPAATAEDQDGEIIDLLYRAVLRRPSDGEGRAAYAHLLRAGLPLPDLIALLMNSAEFRATTLAPADPTGLQGGPGESDP